MERSDTRALCRCCGTESPSIKLEGVCQLTATSLSHLSKSQKEPRLRREACGRASCLQGTCPWHTWEIRRVSKDSISAEALGLVRREERGFQTPKPRPLKLCSRKQALSFTRQGDGLEPQVIKDRSQTWKPNDFPILKLLEAGDPLFPSVFSLLNQNVDNWHPTLTTPSCFESQEVIFHFRRSVCRGLTLPQVPACTSPR